MSENQVVYLNVGGQLYATTEATLSSELAADSRLKAAVSAHVAHMRGEAAAAGLVRAPEIPLDPAHQGAVFLDRDGPSFRFVLNYLRNDGQLVPPTDMGSAQQLLQEAQYYQLPGLVRQMQEHVMALETARGQADRQQDQPGAPRLQQFVGGNDCQTAVHHILQLANAEPQGVHADTVINSLAGRYDRREVERALAALTEEAIVYNTIDDFHYRLA